MSGWCGERLVFKLSENKDIIIIIIIIIIYCLLSHTKKIHKSPFLQRTAKINIFQQRNIWIQTIDISKCSSGHMNFFMV